MRNIFKKIFGQKAGVPLTDLIFREQQRDRQAWLDMVDGMVEVFVPSECTEAFEQHMLFGWNQKLKDWCKTNTKGKYIFGHLTYLGPFVYFEFEEDAIAFKLRWL